MTNEERAAREYPDQKPSSGKIDCQMLAAIKKKAYIAGLEDAQQQASEKEKQKAALIELMRLDEPRTQDVEANEWVSVEDRLPETLETVWLCNIKNKSVSLGCLVDPPNEGWHWAETNGVIYAEDGLIVSECESDDLEVTHWVSLPNLPQPPKD